MTTLSNDAGEQSSVEGFEGIQAVYAQLQKLEREIRQISSPEELAALEQEIRRSTDALAGFLLQSQLQANLDSAEQQEREAELIKSCQGKWRNEGYETVCLYTVSGLKLKVRTRYYRRGCDRRRKKRHKGLYAGLIVLGIHERCTPWLSAMVSSWCALLSSFEEVRQVLLEQGTVLGVKVLRRISYRYAQRARVQQQVGNWVSPQEETLSARRVVISCDGGRVRLRENKRGRKTRKGRTRYQGAWREPKLLIIYVVDAQGRQQKGFAPWIDGTLQGPDALFGLLRDYLQRLGIEQADQVLFVADGAHWIWNRVPGLVKALGLKSEQVHEVVDFYHAVEHLGKVASLRKCWSAKQRNAWIRKQRGLLKKGQAASVVEAVRAMCRGRNGKAITTERNYFIRNQHRMAYPNIKALNLPRGSGAIESAIRRVVNLRLKGPCTFWHRENAEKMLMLRSYYKAGRWNLLKRMANACPAELTY